MKSRNFKKPIFLFLILLGFNISIFALSVSTRMDSVNLLMGKKSTLYLEIVKNKGEGGYLSIFKDIDNKHEYIGICGDSVELGTSYRLDSTDIGSGKIQLNYSIPIQAFDSGTYQLPPFRYIAGGDTAESNYLTFNVYPVDVMPDEEISEMAPVEEPDNPQFYDWVPDWIIDFWWIILICCLAIAAFIWAIIKYKKGGLPKILSKSEPLPWVVALKSLEELKAKKLWEQGMEKEYFTDLTDILRTYLYKRFGINALEMTSRQIIDRINQSEFKDKKAYVDQILYIADFVKFAKVRPLPADNITAYDNAVKFVEETKPDENKESSDIQITKEGGED